MLVLLDLSAAFDTGAHDTSMWFALTCFKTYLADRKFKVIVKDKESEIGNMKYEVPQGTIWGAVLFIMYTLTLQYMLNYYNVSYHFYADDTQKYFELDSKYQCVSKLNTVLRAVQTWIFLKKLEVE